MLYPCCLTGWEILKCPRQGHLHVHLYFLHINSFSVEIVSLRLFLFLFSDLETFKTQRRNAVRVREGQGVVLLCGPPPHSGGNPVCSYLSLLFVYLSCRCPPAWLICAPHTWALWRDAVSLLHNAGSSTCRITSPARHRPHIYLVSWKLCLLASLRSPDCLSALRRSAEWVIFTLGHSGPVSLISSWRRGKTLACRLRRMSAAGAQPSWVITALPGRALFASLGPFAPLTLSMGLRIRRY